MRFFAVLSEIVNITFSEVFQPPPTPSFIRRGNFSIAAVHAGPPPNDGGVKEGVGSF